MSNQLAGALGSETFPPHVEECVRSELAAGERLVWVGRPSSCRYALKTLRMIIVGIPFMTVHFVYLYIDSLAKNQRGANRLNQPGRPVDLDLLFLLCALAFGTVGFILLLSPFWMWLKARRTCYALTDRRTIIWEPRWFGGHEVRSYTAQALSALVRKEKRGGSGDLIFQEIEIREGKKCVKVERGFIAIERVRDVEELVRNTLQGPVVGRLLPGEPQDASPT